ncbi:hypothetical protein SAMN05421824_0832 [Hyunsoonleella jejuensis]|uniref:TonB protein C-terminal n=1 Tax=Hyunsoonleella jejuensis TaxID=419940 RepID=A0A1H9C8M0_9FLAO|nr:hypothetical protein [Hyunsoonleella jejuensis]SEP97536.1 hypothetical protein SAMN05421824_0832 [Hyunsoonleella jejuensis]
MKQFCLILLVLSVNSCDYFNVKKTSSEAILQEELQTFDWENVDTYPSFSQCDSLQLKEEKRVCFESTVYAEISEFLQEQIIIVTQDVNDTLILKLRVSNTGEISLLNAKMDSLTKAEIPELEKLILQGLDTLPKINPAIKRSQPVSTEFELPLIVKVN